MLKSLLKKMVVSLNSALFAAESYFNIQKSDHNLTRIKKFVLGTTTKGAIFSVAGFTHILAKATSTLLQNRVHSLKTYADQAGCLSLRTIQSLNEPFAPQIREVQAGCFRQKTKEEIIKGPTLLNYLHNKATHIQAQLPLKKIAILSGAIAASAMLYHYATANPAVPEVFVSNPQLPAVIPEVCPLSEETMALARQFPEKDFSIYAAPKTIDNLWLEVMASIGVIILSLTISSYM